VNDAYGTKIIDTVDNENVVISSSHPITHWTANPYIKAATSNNTRKAYRQDIRHFESWGGKLPAATEDVIRYLERYAARLNPRTLARRLIAIRNWHTYQGFQDPTHHAIVTKTMSGILRTHGRPKRKARALTPDDMQRVANHLRQENTLASHRDLALLLVGYFGAFRRSELVAIKMDDIHWHNDGIDILIPTSKTDPTHEGQYAAVPIGNKKFCPVAALKAWLYLADIKKGPIFRRITLGEHLGDLALTPLSVNHILKARAKQVGLTEIETISSHSLRRGLATSAARAGAPLQSIMRAGRWKQTNTVMEYIDAADRLTDHAAKHILSKIGGS